MNQTTRNLIDRRDDQRTDRPDYTEIYDKLKNGLVWHAPASRLPQGYHGIRSGAVTTPLHGA